MCQYFETIQLFQGHLRNLEYHQERFERTRREKLGIRNHPRLAEAIKIPRGLQQGLLKCRVHYDQVIEHIEFEAQTEHKVESLRLVYSDSIDYSYKYADRSALEELYSQRGNCDDILVVKKGKLSDSFYANVVFYTGEEWITPDTPLLPGTMRASLMNRGLIREASVTPDDLKPFSSLKLINALNDWERARELPINAIHF